MVNSVSYVGKRIDPDLLMGLRPEEVFSLDDHSGAVPNQRVYTGQTWLRNQECTGCDVRGFYVLGAYRAEQAFGLNGERPMKGTLVLPCSDCGTVLDEYPRSG